MKRILTAVIALVIMLGAAAAHADDEVLTTKYFTLLLPSGWLIEKDAETDQEEGIESLALFAAPDDIGIVAAAYLIYYEDLKHLSLWSSDAEELQNYIDAVMEDFADDKPEYIGTVMAGSIPFVLIKGTDEDGDFLYADTITNGYAIEFMAYVTDPEGENNYPFTEGYIEQFKSILASFTPIN